MTIENPPRFDRISLLPNMWVINRTRKSGACTPLSEFSMEEAVGLLKAPSIFRKAASVYSPLGKFSSTNHVNRDECVLKIRNDAIQRVIVIKYMCK